MRKFLLIAMIALLGTLGLSACNKSGQNQSSAPAQATKPTNADVDNAIKACQAKNPQAAAPAPASASSAPASAQASAPASASAPAAAEESPEDNPCLRFTVAYTTWQPYLQRIVTENMGDIANSPYVYFVPSNKYPENAGAIDRIQQQLEDTVAATVLPGNMVAAAGPDSATTALVLETAFKDASPGSFKGVVVLFMGDQADAAAVKAAVDPSGATFKFAAM